MPSALVLSSWSVSVLVSIVCAEPSQSRFHKFPGAKEIYVPNPTWANHVPIFRSGYALRRHIM